MKGFTKEHALIVKGAMVLLLLFHHLFFGDTISVMNIETITDDIETLKEWVNFGKLCVSGFAFISAYGITLQLLKADSIRELAKITIARLIKIMSACFFVYCLAIPYKRFIVHQSIKEIYMDPRGNFQPVFMLIDSLGLANFFHTPTVNVTWWYLSFAILLVLFLPAIYLLYTKCRFFLFPLSLFLLTGVAYYAYLGIVILGVAFAYENWFEKIEKYVKDKRKNMIFLLLIIFASYITFEIAVNFKDTYLAMSYVGVIFSMISMLYLSKIPLLSPFLEFLGTYSADIFMIHTFIYLYFYSDFIYSFRKTTLIYAALLVLSLFVSILIGQLKRIIKYDILVNKGIKYIQSLLLNN